MPSDRASAHRDEPGRGSPRDAPKRGFLPEIHSFRAVAIIAVVMTHVVDLLAWRPAAADGPAGSLTQRLIYSVAQNGTVLFLFVAGFLFQHLSDRFDYASHLRSKMRNVILPYLVISTPIIVHQFVRRTGIFAGGRPADVIGVVARVGSSLALASHLLVPFWFIPVIAVLYLAAPLLLFIDRRPAGYWLILPLLALSMFAHRPRRYDQIGHSLLYFAPTYLLGMWFSHYRPRVMTALHRWRWALCAVAAGLVAVEVWGLGRGGAIFSQGPFSTEAGVVDLNLPMKVVVSFLLVVFLAGASARLHRRLSYLAAASFGVFFVHRPLILGLLGAARRAGHKEIPGGFISLAVFSALVVVVSLLVVAAIRALAGPRSRFIVGC